MLVPNKHHDANSLARQPMGILPTREFWDGRRIAPVRAAIAGISAVTAVTMVGMLAPSGASLWLTSAAAGLATGVTVTLVFGFVERFLRSSTR